MQTDLVKFRSAKEMRLLAICEDYVATSTQRKH